MTIKELREMRGMTQEELASELGNYQPDVSRWETGRVKPTKNYIAALAAVFEVGVEDITFEQDKGRGNER